MTSRQWRLAVVAELVLGAVLGSLFLGTHSLFLDESVSSTLATRALALLRGHRHTSRGEHGAVLPVAPGVGRLRARRGGASQPFGDHRRWGALGGGHAGALVVRPAGRSSRRVAARGGSALRAIRPGRPRVFAGALARQRVLLLLRPGCSPSGPTFPVLLDGVHRRHGPRRLQQLLGRARARRAGSVAGFPPTGADPVAPHFDVGRRAGRSSGPPRLADRGHGQRGRELGFGFLGRPLVHAHPCVDSPCRSRPAGARRGRRSRRGRFSWRVADPPSGRSSTGSGHCSSRCAGSSCRWPPW